MGKIRNIAYVVGVVAGFALLGRGCLGMYRFSNALTLVEDYESTSAYIELKVLADVDRNGEMSEVERKLMFARLDEHRYAGGGGDWPWKDVVNSVEERIITGGRTYWTPNDRRRISYALALYKQENRPKQ